MPTMMLQKRDATSTVELSAEGGMEAADSPANWEIIRKHEAEAGFIGVFPSAAKLSFHMSAASTDDLAVVMSLFNASTQMFGYRVDNFIEVDQESVFPGIIFETKISPKNEAALKLIADWMKTPDELGPKWWRDFERGCLHKFRLGRE